MRVCITCLATELSTKTSPRGGAVELPALLLQPVEGFAPEGAALVIAGPTVISPDDNDIDKELPSDGAPFELAIASAYRGCNSSTSPCHRHR